MWQKNWGWPENYVCISAYKNRHASWHSDVNTSHVKTGEWGGVGNFVETERDFACIYKLWRQTIPKGMCYLTLDVPFGQALGEALKGTARAPIAMASLCHDTGPFIKINIYM